MNDINMLEELGLQEVSRKTHIEVKHLQWMVGKKFDKLNRINTLGFVKILSREYRLDLSEWVEEFEAYWQENRRETPHVERMYISSARHSSKRRWPWVLVLLLAIVVGAGWYFDAMKYMEIPNLTEPEQNVSHVYTTTPIVEEARENLETLVLQEENQTVVEEPIIVHEEDNASMDNNSTALEEPIKTSMMGDPMQGSEKSAYFIQPGAKIWVGIIYLDTMKRDSFLTEGNIVFDMKQEQIVTTGHGKFDLIKGETKESFNSEFPKRFHIKDNQIMPISYQEFIDLNKGKPW